MLSVVVPAAWGYDPFCNFLEHVAELPVVGEIILINNNVAQTPDHPVLDHPKVKHHKMEKNIFVNPAWNLGVSLATFDKVCILSDDVSVDLRAFFEGDKFISKEKGILWIGIPWNVYRLHMEQFDQINFDNLKHLIIKGDATIKHASELPDTCGGGSLFFIHKDNWIPIPDELKIYWGDTWQQDMQGLYRRNNYFLNDCFYYSPWSGAARTGISAEYQASEEFKKNENFEYFYSLKQRYVESLNTSDVNTTDVVKTSVQQQWNITFKENQNE